MLMKLVQDLASISFATQTVYCTMYTKRLPLCKCVVTLFDNCESKFQGYFQQPVMNPFIPLVTSLFQGHGYKMQNKFSVIIPINS